MNAPAVQYVTTSDGYDIAYAVSGEGRTLLMTPTPFRSLTTNWRSQSLAPLYDELASHFRVVMYDSRGVGMSTRGLPQKVTLEHYLLDLDAVVKHCCPEPAVLYGPLASGHVAVRYAIEMPRSVAGLILHQVNVDDPLEGVRYLEPLARASWENFLKIPAYNFYRKDEPQEAIRMLREVVHQEDFLRQMTLAPESLRPILPLIQAATLIVAMSGAFGPRVTGEGEGRLLASLIPGARLLIHEPSVTNQILAASITKFSNSLPQPSEQLAEIHTPGSAGGGAGVLSNRELEVLRLLEQGRSNPQIARELLVTRSTVQHHVSSILNKTGTQNRTEAVVYAKDHGIV